MMEDKQHWSRIGESGTILGMRILLLIHRVFGRWAFRLVLWPVMFYFFRNREKARRASHQYLNRMAAYSDGAFVQNTRWGSFQHFIAFGEALLDKFLVWMGDIDKDQVDFMTPDIFRELEGSSRGGLIIVSHLGNTEICSALAHRLPGLKLTILVYTQHAVKFNSLLNRISSSRQIEMLQVTEITPTTAMMLSERIESGEMVVIAGDRTPVTGQHRTSSVSFLGEQASFPQGPVILAGLFKCPVYLLFCLKRQGRYRIYFERFSTGMTLPRMQRVQFIDAAVQRYAAVLEQYCLKEPLQWFNYYSFWHDHSDGESNLPRSR